MPSKDHWILVAEDDILPSNTGGRVDQVGFLDAIQQAGIECSLVIPSRDGSPDPYRQRYPSFTVTLIPRKEGGLRHASLLPYVVRSRPVPPGLGDAPGLRAETATAVISMTIRSAHIGQILARRWHLPHAVRLQNVEADYFRDLAGTSAGARKVGYLLESVRFRRYERHLNQADHVDCFLEISEQEAARRRSLTTKPVLHLPAFALRHESAAREPDHGDRAGVVFVGSLDVETNTAALDWFLTYVWPRIRERSAAATFDVVGRSPSATLERRLSDQRSLGVTLRADVADVDPFLRRAAVAVNPVRTGAGISVKLLNGMACGCACVSTSPGATGMDWEAGRHLLVADDATEFADAVVRLLDDQQLRDRVAVAGREFVRTRLDPNRNVELVRRALWEAGEKG